jgi:hypothetical protein
MKARQSLNVVPRPVRVLAVVALSCAVVAGSLAGHFGSWSDSGKGAGEGFLVGLGAGAFVACWVLAVGYVYGDANRRVMPAALWTLAAALIPNLLGFLLYFVLRRPIAQPCKRCSQLVHADQRFCSWCGEPEPTANNGGYSGLNPTAAV